MVGNVSIEFGGDSVKTDLNSGGHGQIGLAISRCLDYHLAPDDCVLQLAYALLCFSHEHRSETSRARVTDHASLSLIKEAQTLVDVLKYRENLK